MKFALLLLLAVPCVGADWSLVQVATNKSTNCNNASGTSCSVTVSSTGTGHVLVMMVNTTTGNHVSAVANGGTWSHNSSCLSDNATVGRTTDLWYTLSSTSGATTITATVPTGTARAGAVYEFAFSGTSPTFDACNNANNTTAGTSQTGPSLTLTGTSDIIVQGIQTSTSATITAITGGYTLDWTSASVQDSAHLLNTTVGSAVTWTTQSTESVTNAIAIFDTPPAAPASGGKIIIF